MYKVYGNLHIKLFTLKIVLLVVGDLNFSCSDFWWFCCPLRFSLNSDCLSVPGKLIDGQVLDVDEVLLVRWKLVIGDFKVCVQFFFKNVAIYWSCGWKLGMLDLTQNWFEIVFQAFDFSSQKNRLVMIEWNCQFS